MNESVNNNNITNTDLFDLMQNDALGVIALHSFTLGYHNIARNKTGGELFPKLSYLFYVLPVVYNYASMVGFLNSNELYTALVKEPSVSLGLQERANKMVFQTFDALNLAFSKKILGIDRDKNIIILVRPFTSKKLPIYLSSFRSYDSLKQIQDSAFKFGSIFAKKHDKNLQLDLNIRF
jgi:hypothetical protein